MEINVWDASNAGIALLVTLYVCGKFGFSQRVCYLLLFHVFLICILDLFMPYSYMPDQFGYLQVSSGIRNNFVNNLADIIGIEHSSGYYDTGAAFKVSFASYIFAFFPFPVFIQSVKSLAFFNYYIYLGLFTFVLHKITNVQIQTKAKYLFFLYPTLIFYTSTGVRDIMIVALMFFSLYYIIIERSRVVVLLCVCGLGIIKFQNALLIILVLFVHVILNINNIWLRRLILFLYIACLLGLFIVYFDQIMFFRRAMFLEDNLGGGSIPTWSIVDIYRVLFAPMFFDARNAMQLIQSCENLGLFIVVFKFVKYIKKFKVDVKNYFLMIYFVIISAILYSLVVFNYGTLTRYKFPFIFCWICINLMMVDNAISQSKVSDNIVISK